MSKKYKLLAAGKALPCYAAIRATCKYRGKMPVDGTLPPTPDQCYHHKLTRRTECCKVICPELSIRRNKSTT